MSLSVCIIVKNEEENIVRCISQAQKVADEIVLVDTGSTDKTVDLAKALGVEVHSFPWINDFAAARNFSLSKATKKWILWIDADDMLDYKTCRIINEAKKKEPSDRVLCFWLHNVNPCDSVFINKEPDMQIRMFPNNPGIRFVGKVHETILASLKTLDFYLEVTSGKIDHDGYQEKDKVTQKIKRNIRHILWGSGFPSGCEFYEIEDGNFFGFYAPETLSVWGDPKGVGHLECLGNFDPFYNGVPISESARKNAIYNKFTSVIEAELKQVVDVVDLIKSQIDRLGKSVDKLTLVNI